MPVFKILSAKPHEEIRSSTCLPYLDPQLVGSCWSQGSFQPRSRSLLSRRYCRGRWQPPRRRSAFRAVAPSCGVPVLAGHLVEQFPAFVVTFMGPLGHCSVNMQGGAHEAAASRSAALGAAWSLGCRALGWVCWASGPARNLGDSGT